MAETKTNHVLITGPPGIGKSTLYGVFRDRGINAVDADDVLLKWGSSGAQPARGASFSWMVKNPPMWDTKKLKELLRDNNEIYVFGVAFNTPLNVTAFDKVIYLDGSEKLVTDRLGNIRKNAYGSTSAQRRFAAIVTEILNLAAKVAARISKRFRVVDVNASLSPEELFLKIHNGQNMEKDPNLAYLTS